MKRPTAIFLMGMAIWLCFPQRSGAQWEEAGRLGDCRVNSLLASGTNLFAATDTGLFLSADNGVSWTAVASGFPEKIGVSALAMSGPYLFAGTNKGVLLSTNNGTDWSPVNSGLPAETSVGCLLVSGPNLFAGTNHGVFLATNNGENWIAVNSGLPSKTPVRYLALCGTNLFAGTYEKGIFISTSSGASWKEVNSEKLKKNELLCLAASGPNLFAGTVYGGVFLSTDNGAQWKAVNSGLPRTEIHCFAVSGTNLFVGTGGGIDVLMDKDELKRIVHGGGVLLSSDNGASWTAINSGLPPAPIRAELDKRPLQIIDITPDNPNFAQAPGLTGREVGAWVECLAVSGTNLFAGTQDSKVWRLPLSDLSLALNLSDPVLSRLEWAKVRKEFPEAVVIPKEIKAVMQEGLAARQGRQGIPFTIFKYSYLPAQHMPGSILLYPGILVNLPEKAYAAKDFLHAVLFLKARNADLGYAPQAGAPAPEQLQASSLPASVHKSNLNVFIEFRQTDDTGASNVVREVLALAALVEDSATFDPNKENWYSIGYALRPGKYTVVVALTPRTIPSTKTSEIDDLKKVGVGYFDIDLPGPESYQEALELTPVFFEKKVEQMEEPDLITFLHKGMFTWANIQAVPKLDYVVSPGERIEIVYYILGAKPIGELSGQAKYDIESTYEVQKEDGTVAILWKAQNYDEAFISQSLTLKQSLKIRDDQGERQEQRDLTAGKYFLMIIVKDKVSGLTVEKKVPFEVR